MNLSNAFMLFLVIVSSICVIYSKNQSRILFAEIQTVERKLDEEQIEWDRMRLELTTWAEHNRIEQRARKSLGFVIPDRQSIVYLKPS